MKLHRTSNFSCSKVSIRTSFLLKPNFYLVFLFFISICAGALPAIVKSAALAPLPALQEAVSRTIASLTTGSEPNAAAAAACGAIQAIAAGCTLQMCGSNSVIFWQFWLIPARHPSLYRALVRP
jgi:uncharacterized membrane protein YagU involved in acid resistance